MGATQPAMRIHDASRYMHDAGTQGIVGSCGTHQVMASWVCAQADFSISFGHDYSGFDYANNPQTAGTTADACEALCYQDSKCLSFTWTAPGQLPSPAYCQG